MVPVDRRPRVRAVRAAVAPVLPRSSRCSAGWSGWVPVGGTGAGAGGGGQPLRPGRHGRPAAPGPPRSRRRRPGPPAVWLLALAPPAYTLVLGYAEAILLLCSTVALLGLRTGPVVVGGGGRAGGRGGPARRAAGGGAGGRRALVRQRRRDPAGRPAWRPGGGRWWPRLVGAGAYLAWVRRRLRRRLAPVPGAGPGGAPRASHACPFDAMWHNVVSVTHGHHLGSALHVPWVLLCVVLLVVAFRRLPLVATPLFAAAVLAVSVAPPTSTPSSGTPWRLPPGRGRLDPHLAARRVERVVLVVAALGMVGYAYLAFLGIVGALRSTGAPPAGPRHDPEAAYPCTGTRRARLPGARSPARRAAPGGPSAEVVRAGHRSRTGVPTAAAARSRLGDDVRHRRPSAPANQRKRIAPSGDAADDSAAPSGAPGREPGTGRPGGGHRRRAGRPDRRLPAGRRPATRWWWSSGTRWSAGISRTVERDGWRFDIGGHRFFTKVKPVEEFWHEILPARGLPAAAPDEPDLLRRQVLRLPDQAGQRPVQPGDRGGRPVRAVVPVGPDPSAQGPVDTLEGYIVSNYGWRLYRHFFKTYNEKVWGVPASELSADWGAQRIKGMSLWNAVWEPIRSSLAGRRRDRSKQVTSLIEEFQYPKYGPGMMWERCAEQVVAVGGEVRMETAATAVHVEDGRAVAVTVEPRRAPPSGSPASHVISLHALHRPGPDRRPAGARRGAGRPPTTSTTATSSPWPWWCPRTAGSPTTGSTSTRPTSRWAASRTSGRGRRSWSRTAGPAWAWSTSCSRATSCGTCPDDDLVALATKELAAIGLVDPSDVEAGLRGADAQGLPGLRRRLPRQRGGASAAGSRRTPRTSTRWAATACTSTTTRTTRCTRPC